MGPYIRWRKGKYPYPTTITEIRPCLVKCFWAHNYYLCFSFYFQSMCRYRTPSFFHIVCADIGTFGNFSWPRESPALLVDFIILPPTKDFIVSHAWLDEGVFRRNSLFHFSVSMRSTWLKRREVFLVKNIPSKGQRNFPRLRKNKSVKVFLH